MNKILSLLIGLIALMSMGSANVWTSISMNSGSDSFTDVTSISGDISGNVLYSLSNTGMTGGNSFEMGPNDFSFSEVTTSSWLKQNYLSDDPYVSISKSITNVGSGIATSDMRFSDLPTGFSLLSGFKVDNNIDSSWAQLYSTDYTSWVVNDQISVNRDAIDFLSGQKFDRSTWALDNFFQYTFL
jgi:hypothetical protein